MKAKEIMAAARSALGEFEAHEAAITDLTAAKQRLLKSATVDAANIRKYGEIQSGLALAQELEPVLDARALEVAREFQKQAVYLTGEIASAHRAIDEALTEAIRDEVPEGVRDGINVTRTKRYRDEQSARPNLNVYTAGELDSRSGIKALLTTAVESCEMLIAEGARVAGVAKKLGIAL